VKGALPIRPPLRRLPRPGRAARRRRPTPTSPPSSSLSIVEISLHAALERGAETFWDALDEGINAGLDGFTVFLGQLVPRADEREIRLLARAFRRTFFAALLDRTISADETRDLLWSLLAGSPLALAPHARTRSARLAAVG
jgi:hypothetical protein